MGEFLYYRGRVALYAILRGLGVTAGDEVVVQAYTCAAVLEPLRRLGVRPVFTDIDPATYTMDPIAAKEAIGPDTKAVIVQHTFGNVSVLPDGVPVIEDRAHLLPGAPVHGVAAFHSYEWGKPVVAGVGGSAVVPDPGLAAIMRAQYAEYADPPSGREMVMNAQYAAYRVVNGAGMVWRARALYRRLAGAGLIVGSYSSSPETSEEYGWRMSRTVARRLIRRREAVDAGARRRVAGALRAGLGLAPLDPGAPVPLRVPVEVHAKLRVLREAAAAGVEVGDWFVSPVHPLTGSALAGAGYVAGSFPRAEFAADHVVTVPVRETGDVDRVLGFFRRMRAAGHA